MEYQQDIVRKIDKVTKEEGIDEKKLIKHHCPSDFDLKDNLKPGGKRCTSDCDKCWKGEVK